VKAKTSNYDTADLIFKSFKSLPSMIEKMIAFTAWINQNFQKA
jgi:hypothetical protein